MAGKPGKSGRRAGIPNKVTTEAREAISKFVNGNAHRLQKWLDQVAEGVPKKDADGNIALGDNGEVLYQIPPKPDRAFELFGTVVEYHIPKLNRTEVTGADGGAIDANVSVTFVSPIKS